MDNKDYIVIVQCDLVMQRCSGYFCEKAFHERSGGFGVYRADKAYRTLYLTCGGCCGRGLHRKLENLANKLLAQEKVARDRIAVQLATCMTKDNYHGPPCPHLDYIKTLVGRLKLDYRENTHMSLKAQQKRDAGVYQS